MSTFTVRLTVLALVLSSCGAIAPRPLVAPDKGGAAWTQVTSPHFVLKTDFQPDDARRASAKLEDMFAALSDFGFASSDKPKIRLEVVYFRSLEAYTEFGPKMSSGVFNGMGRHSASPFAADRAESTLPTSGFASWTPVSRPIRT